MTGLTIHPLRSGRGMRMLFRSQDESNTVQIDCGLDEARALARQINHLADYLSPRRDDQPFGAPFQFNDIEPQGEP